MAGGNERADKLTFESFDSFQSVSRVEIQASITGYELVEARKRFTVFQINIQPGNGRNWFIFRRYSDFMKLDQELKELLPEFPARLPPKKYLGDNFDPQFLELRKNGLQTYLQCVRTTKIKSSIKFFKN